MNIDIFNIVMDRTKKGKTLSIMDYVDIISIAVKENKLENFVNKISISHDKSGYNYYLNGLNINTTDIEKSKNRPIDLKSSQNILCFNNFYSLFPVFHELKHVTHEKNMAIDKNSIQSKVLSLSIYATINPDIKDKNRTKKQMSVYKKYHDLFIHERVANIEAISDILDISSFLNESYDDVYRELLLLLMSYYISDYNDYFAPSRVVFDKLNKLDIYENILEITKKSFIEERIKYGLGASKPDVTDCVVKLYNKLKRI